jgi:hypothetical protein
MRCRTSLSQAKGSTLLSFAVAMREQMVAHRTPPPSEPANRWFLRPSAISRSFCPCRAGNRTSLQMASVFWLHGPHSPCGATGDRPVLEGPGSDRCCCFHGCVDARPGDVRRNDHRSTASATIRRFSASLNFRRCPWRAGGTIGSAQP